MKPGWFFIDFWGFLDKIWTKIIDIRIQISTKFPKSCQLAETLTPRIFGVRKFQDILGKVELEISPFLASILFSFHIGPAAAAGEGGGFCEIPGLAM